MRVDYSKAFPKGYAAMISLEAAVRSSGLEPLLLELIKLRASQINGCAYCLDMHSKDARARGEDEQRLHVLAAWREAPFYSARERAALAWCEALTLLPQTAAPDEVFAEVKQQFSDEEIAALTFQIVTINGWNRLAVGLRTPVGDYVSPFRQRADAAARAVL
ncbi:MAG TPA: carboxymuconolactone decarboxylase family protein [Solirubrobacteraceae bacterium]|nr:carboxymuconolactone decarboxylase family protein [Solirubrobacteraceae bacterium]